MLFTLHDHSDSGTSDLLGVCVDQCRDSVTLEGQANPKESRERRAESGSQPEGWDERRGTEGRCQSKVTNREREGVRSKDRVELLIY